MSISGINSKSFKRDYNGYSKYLENIKDVRVGSQISLEELAQELKTEYNIYFPERLQMPEDIYTHKVIDEIKKNRKDLRDDGRPRAVFIFTKTDPSRAFSKDDNHMAEYIKRGYKIFYYEVSTDNEFYQALKEVGQNKPVDVLEIAGHGNPHWIRMSADTPVGKGLNEKFIIDDIFDGIEMKDLNLMPYMARGSKIILNSCSTGKMGRYHSENIQRLFQKTFTDSEVFAPVYDMYGYTPVFDANSRLAFVNFIYDWSKPRS